MSEDHPVFIDPFSDTGFKAIFGREGMSETVLRDFINEVFRGEPMFEHVKEVRFNNTVRNSETDDDKTIIHDVTCITESGHRFIVEMQKGWQDNFVMRAVYYVSRGITDQALRYDGDPVWEYSIKPVAGVFVSAFRIPGLPDKVLTHLGLVDTDTKEFVYDHIRFAFIQTPYFNKQRSECHTAFDKIIYVLKNMPTLEEIPFKENPDDIFSRMEQLARYANLTKRERAEYAAELKRRRDEASRMSSMKRLGLEEGEAKGRADEKLEIARKMKAGGMSAEQIASFTGLTPEEIIKIN